jgi:hypothetical protein
MAGYISGNTRITGQGSISTVPISAGGFRQTFTFGNAAVLGFQTFSTTNNSSGILAYSAQTYVLSFDSGDTWTTPQSLPANTACLEILQTNNNTANITIVNTTTNGNVNVITTPPPTQASPVLPAPTPVTLPAPNPGTPTTVTPVVTSIYPYPATAPTTAVWYVIRGNAVYKSTVANPTQTSDWILYSLPISATATSVATDGQGDVIVTTQNNVYVSADGANTFNETQVADIQGSLQTSSYNEYADSFVIGGENGQIYQANVAAAQANTWSNVNSDPDAQTANIVQISSSDKDNCTLVAAVQDVAITAAKGVVWKALLGAYSLLGSLAEYIFLPKKPSAALCYAGRTFLGNQDGSIDVQQNSGIDASFFRNGFGYIVRATNKTYTWAQIAALGNIQAEVQSQLGPGWSTLDTNDLNTGGSGPITVTTRDEYRKIALNMNNVYPYQTYSNGAPTSAAILGYITNGNVYATPQWGFKLAYAGETDVRNPPINLSIYGAPGSGFWPQTGTGNSISNAEIVVTNSSTTISYPIIAKLATSQQIISRSVLSSFYGNNTSITYTQGSAVYRVDQIGGTYNGGVNAVSQPGVGNIAISQPGNGVYSNFDLIAVGGGGGGGWGSYYDIASTNYYYFYGGLPGGGGGGGGIIIETGIASQVGNIIITGGEGAEFTSATENPYSGSGEDGGNTSYQLWGTGATRYAVGGGGGAGGGGPTRYDYGTITVSPVTGRDGGSGGGGFFSGAGGNGTVGEGNNGAAGIGNTWPYSSVNGGGGGGGAGGAASGANAGPGIQTDIITGTLSYVGGGGAANQGTNLPTGGCWLYGSLTENEISTFYSGAAGGGGQGGFNTRSYQRRFQTPGGQPGGVWIRYRIK